jgi:hypothetical protein
MSADSQPVRTDFDLDIVVADTSEVHANPEAGGALENIDLRAPLRAGFLKSCEVDFGKLVGDFANLAFDETETQRADFSTHTL